MSLLHARNPLESARVEMFRGRLTAMVWAVSLLMFGLLSRLYTLQVLRGEEMSHKGRRNFVSQIDVSHDRGIIFDRRGRILVDNRPSLNLRVTPAFLGSKDDARRTLQQVARIVGTSGEDLAKIVEWLDTRQGLDRFRPLVVARDLNSAQVEAIESERSLFLLDGVEIAEGRRRIYRFGQLAAHLLGYVGEIDGGLLDAERARGNPNHYELGDFIGREGIERTLEGHLRGQDGSEKVVVDAKGRRQRAEAIEALLGEHRRQEPKPGHNVYLTLDLELQQLAEQSFLQHGRAGSVVALDAKTGELLVLASLPAYDANLVSGAFSYKEKERLDTDVLKPWLNRSISGQYAPGSTFKVVTALAGLQAHATGDHERVTCPGNYRMGRHIWRCWRDAGHGPTDLRSAFRQSCDVFFYTIGGRIGIDPIAAMGRTLGFGRRSGIGLRGEQPGTMPDEAFHRRSDAASGGYVKGMAINTSIGQGAVAITPLQLALAYAAIARGTVQPPPALVNHIETADQRISRYLLAEDGNVVTTQMEGDGPMLLEQVSPVPQTPLPIAPEHLQAVRDGLSAVTQEPGGTAYAFRSRKVTTAGKTGSAQVVKLGKERLKGWQIDYFERDHAWFVAYAPIEDPAIVVVVLNEHGGHGGSAAAPVSMDIIDAFMAARANDVSQQAAARAAQDMP